MNILLHTCCAPCSIYPVLALREKGFDVTAFFYNPNIHPYLEYKKRLQSVIFFCETNSIPLIVEDQYQLNDFLRAVVFREHLRCTICQSLRIEKSLTFAESHNFEFFTTSLLYSRYQKHDEIKQQCEEISAEKMGTVFYYEDFRVGWQYGIDASLSQGLYRQPYCGCIYSEQERYDKIARSKREKNHDKNHRISHKE